MPPPSDGKQAIALLRSRDSSQQHIQRDPVMLVRRQSLTCVAFLLTLLAGRLLQAQLIGEQPVAASNPETAIVEAATGVLNEVMAIPAKSIPTSMLADAEGIAVVPGMVKGGFVIGIRHGRGIVVTRAPGGGWTAPSFITITGGSIGWQAGLQSTDVILVFKTKSSIQGLMQGKFTIGADAAAAAGPVGRNASIGTDVRLRAEIYSYSRSRGLFAGVALDGSSIQIDGAANNQYYWSGGAPASPGQPPPIPASATNFLQVVAKYTSPEAQVVPAVSENAPVGAATTAAQSARQQLIESSQKLDPILDKNWQAYLALPAELSQAGSEPSLQSLAAVAAHFDTVAGNPQYGTLANRPEFQQTYEALKNYAQLRTAAAPLALPPPPQ